MIRVIWWLALALLAAVVIVAQIDRETSSRPELSALVPEPFRGFAQPNMTMLSLAMGSPADTQVEARTLVRRRPIPAENLYLLALADLNAGDKEAYARAFEVATTRGWRSVPVQIAAAEAAIGRGDAASAAPRVAAVWAVEGTNPASLALTEDLLALPSGPESWGQVIAKTRVSPKAVRATLERLTSADKAARATAAARDAGMRFE